MGTSKPAKNIAILNHGTFANRFDTNRQLVLVGLTLAPRNRAPRLVKR